MPSFTISFDDAKPQLWSNSKRISFEGKSQSLHTFLTLTLHTDYLDLEACLFNWGDSYDAKVSIRSYPSSHPIPSRPRISR